MTILITCALRPEWCEFAQRRLVDIGVPLAEQAKRSGLGAINLTAKMSKSMKVSAANSRNFRQVQPGKTWQISAADIFLENSEQEAWGWASPENLFFLDFWSDFDPSCRFILVYGSFAQYIAHEMDNSGDLNKNKDTLFKRWRSYQRELLQFYNENTDHCVLVNITAFNQAAKKISQELQDKFEVETRLINSHDHLDISALKLLAADALLLDSKETHLEYSALENSANIPSEKDLQDSELVWRALEEYEAAIKYKHTASETIEMMQLQLTERELTFKNELKANEDEQINQLNALKESAKITDKRLKHLEIERGEILEVNKKKDKRIKSLEADLMKTDQQVSKYKIEISNLKKEISDSSQQSNFADSQANELLMMQLTQVQEELNFYFDKYNALKKSESKAVESKNAPASMDIAKTPKFDDVPPAKPDELLIDLRKYVNGEGWHSPEMDGRWAGLDLKSTVKVRPLKKAPHKIEITIIDAMSLNILKNMKFKFEGQTLTPSIKIFSHLRGALAPLRRIKASITKVEKPYPLIMTYNVPESLISDSGKSHWIEITVPETKTPSADDFNDFRDLSICVQTIRIRKTS